VVAGTPADSNGVSGRTRIACLSSAPWNPYLRLLYDHLAGEGIEPEPGGSLSARWLMGPARGRVRWLHVHWPEPLYRLNRGPARLRPALSWVKAGVFAGRLALARALGYRVLWTIHQVYPHERAGSLDRVGSAVLARSARVLLAHDDWTAEQARRALGRAAREVAVVPHGSYVGVYPAGRDRAAVRADLGIPADACVFLCLGELRGYKAVDRLLAAFSSAERGESALVIAGNVKDAGTGRAVRQAAERDPRIHQLEGFVPVERVRELYDAADVAVVPRGDGGTSGSLILALSMGVPVVAADAPAYRSVTANGEAGWLFPPDDPASLVSVLEEAAGASAAELAAKRAAAQRAAAALSWPGAARRIAGLLRASV
jgi:beta-1,4-mannosyltransferase